MTCEYSTIQYASIYIYMYIASFSGYKASIDDLKNILLTIQGGGGGGGGDTNFSA